MDLSSSILSAPRLRNLESGSKLFAIVLTISSMFPCIPIASAQELKFEQVSVSRVDRCAMQNSIGDSMVTLHGDPLNVVMMEAFGVKQDQIVGPSWLASECISIDAKMPRGTTKEQLGVMLQNLLADRFQLNAHKEMQLQAGYALVVDDGGSKLGETDLNTRYATAHAGEVTFGAGPELSQIKGAMTTASLARFTSNRLGVPVEDLTGLRGKHDVDVSWIPDRTLEKMGPFARESAATQRGAAERPSDQTTGPINDIFTSFRNSLGLRLDPRKQSTEVLVVDHIDQTPAGN